MREKGTGHVEGPLSDGSFRAWKTRRVNGKLVKSRKCRGRNKTAAIAALAEWEQESPNWWLPAAPAKPKPTVGAFLDAWWKEASPHWAQTTRTTNSYTFDKWLQSDVLRSLSFPPSREQIKEWMAGLSSSATTNTKARIIKLVRTAFNAAVEDGLIASNPAKYKNAPRPNKKRAVEIFSPDEQATLVRHVVTEPDWALAIVIDLDSGMREGELLALRPIDFDFDRRLVQIRRTMDTIRGIPIEKPYAKTDSSLRDIELSPATIELVQRHLEQFPRPLLFQDGDRPWNRHDFLNAYRGLLTRAQLPYRRFHAIRHTCATNLLKAGCYLPAVSKRLGHAKVSTTLDIYAAYLPSDQAPLAMSFERSVRQWLPKPLQGSRNDSPMIPRVGKGAASTSGVPDLRKTKTLENQGLRWCARLDSNQHEIAPASPSS
jgi:integrase